MKTTPQNSTSQHLCAFYGWVRLQNLIHVTLKCSFYRYNLHVPLFYFMFDLRHMFKKRTKQNSEVERYNNQWQFQLQRLRSRFKMAGKKNKWTWRQKKFESKRKKVSSLQETTNTINIWLFAFNRGQEAVKGTINVFKPPNYPSNAKVG